MQKAIVKVHKRSKTLLKIKRKLTPNARAVVQCGGWRVKVGRDESRKILIKRDGMKARKIIKRLGE